jgi:voltage-gated potassium channel
VRASHPFKTRLYQILFGTKDSDALSKAVGFSLMALILLNVICVMLETVEEYAAYSGIFNTIEVVSVSIFTVEYILRLWTITVNPKYRRPILGRIRYALSLMALVDLFAILPFYLPFIFHLDLRSLRSLRLFRLFRLFKMSRYVTALDTLDDVIKAKKEELIVILAMILILLVLASGAMYLAETNAQPDKFPSIPAALWWAVVTLTTVGYGDVSPITPAGKIIAGVIAFLGIGLFALPTGILAAGFAEEIQKRRKKEPRICPHCGKEI